MHETDEHRLNEQRIAAEFADARGCLAYRFISDRHPRIDRALYSAALDGIVGFAEIKCQRNYRLAEPSFGVCYKIGIDKISAARDINFAVGVPVYLVVEFADALIWLDMLMTPFERGHEIYRKDRGTTQNAVAYWWRYFTVQRATEDADRRLARAIRTTSRKAIAATVTWD